MKCLQCQAENDAGARFCEDCGARLEAACPSCGTPVTPGKKFCRSCGAALTTEPAGHFASPESYTPKHLAEKILTSKAALEGERKQVTVLFADLKGSMELLADRDPEEARKILDPVLEHMMEAVHRYEGTVNQVMGDGIMALFGAPLAHEDHAVRACYAALRMQESVKKYAEDVLRSHGVTVRIRVGLNSGEVVVRAIGSDLHMDYTAVGQTTHLAARMEQLADPGTILLPPSTLQLVEGYVDVKGGGAVPVKGLAEPVQVYELVGAGSVRSRLQAAATRGLTRFVGRDPEMEQLRLALERAGHGHGQIVAVVGEPGVGKSRLYWEFIHSHRTEGWLVLESRSVSYGRATSYLPVIDLLKGYFQMDTRDDPRRMREKITGKILSLDEGLRPTLPAFLALLDLPVEEPTWRALDPPQRRRRTLDAIKHLLLRESQVQPLAILFEDLHWIDPETQALLDSLVESLATSRLLLLVNYRPEYQHDWGSKSYYAQLRIDPLPPENAEALLGSLLGSDPALQPLTRLLIDRTDGNPFFLEESVRGLVETGALRWERGAYRLAATLPNIQVPATVQTVVAARIDRLPPEEKRLLQSAAVIGKDVPFALLEAIAELPEPDLRRSLGHLQAAEFLYEVRLFPDLEYTFKHALTHEVAYGSLLQERRRTLHARIVDAVERISAGRIDEQVERLAQHAARGETWEKAVRYDRQAGARAAGRSAFPQAAGFFDDALTALAQLPACRETAELSVDLRLELRLSLGALGEVDRALECSREALTLAESLGDQGRIARAVSSVMHSMYLTGAVADASVLGERAIAEARDDVAQLIVVRTHFGQICHAIGDYRRGIEWLETDVEALRGHPPDRFRVWSCAWLAWCLAELGEFDRATIVAEEGTHLATALDSASTHIGAWLGLGFTRVLYGDCDSAIPVLARGLALCREVDIPYFFPGLAGVLGYAYALSGRLREGVSLLEQAVTRAEIHNRVARARYLSALSEAYLLSGRPDDAVTAARRGLDGASERRERGDQAWNLRALAQIAAQADPRDFDAAEGRYREALALSTELGMRPCLAHCHLGLAKLYRRTGKRQEAQEHLTTATSMYREMGMTYWLEKACDPNADAFSGS